MNFKPLFSSLVALIALTCIASPAFADSNRHVECYYQLSLSSVSDNIAVAIAPREGGAKLLSASCYTDANATLAAVVTLEDGAGNAVTHGTLTCAENGTDATWVSATAGNFFSEGEPIVYDVTNGADAQSYTLCIEYKTRY